MVERYFQFVNTYIRLGSASWRLTPIVLQPKEILRSAQRTIRYSSRVEKTRRSFCSGSLYGDVSMLKTIIKRAAYYSGLEIRRIPAVPAWPKPDTEPPRDEILCNERWVYHALQMANRSYQPERMQYHRTVHGDDTRIKYMTYFLDVRDQRVLEIGPLEGHHSVILEKMGVRENIALESRADNLRKCNRIKDKYRLDRTRFLQHDLERLYRGEDQAQFSGQFDLVFCLGILYHVPEPGRALEWFRSQSPTLFRHALSRR